MFFAIEFGDDFDWDFVSKNDLLALYTFILTSHITNQNVNFVAYMYTQPPIPTHPAQHNPFPKKHKQERSEEKTPPPDSKPTESTPKSTLSSSSESSSSAASEKKKKARQSLSITKSTQEQMKHKMEDSAASADSNANVHSPSAASAGAGAGGGGGGVNDGGYHGLPQVGSPPSALRELPALRDAPPNKREELFKLKLQLCGVIFSFDDPTSDKRGKVC